MPSTAANSEVEWLHVVAAVIMDDRRHVLLAQRPLHKHQGGKWEFPGGKVETNETAQAALARELSEELGIAADEHSMQSLLEVRHQYADKAVWLDVWLVSHFSGEAHGREGQAVEWFPLSALTQLDFPAANQAILDALQLRFS